jgi:hypothetical protein
VTSGAERRRLISSRERIGRRRVWWIAARDRAAARLAELDAELKAAEAALAERDAGEDHPAEAAR